MTDVSIVHMIEFWNFFCYRGKLLFERKKKRNEQAFVSKTTK